MPEVVISEGSPLLGEPNANVRFGSGNQPRVVEVLP